MKEKIESTIDEMIQEWIGQFEELDIPLSDFAEACAMAESSFRVRKDLANEEIRHNEK